MEVLKELSRFSRYRHLYKEPERYSPEIARERRLTAVLERERQFMDLVRMPAALSQVKKTAGYQPKWRVVDDLETKGHKAASIAAALSQFKESDFADPAKRELYRRLRSTQGQQRAKAAASDRRQYSPYGYDFAKTTSGGFASIARGVLTRVLGVPKFSRAHQVLPCIERIVRREVMFATGRAGKGYRTPHRRNWASGIPC